MMKEKFQFNIDYDKDIQHNYLVFETSTDKFDEEYYQVKMILDNNIEGLLKMDIRCNNDKIRLNYYITSKQTLSQLLLNKSITFNDMKDILMGIINNIEYGKTYLLEEDNYIIDSDFIYVGETFKQLFLCYIPSNIKAKSISTSIRELVEYLIPKVIKQDNKESDLLGKLYTVIKSDNYSITEIQELLNYKSKQEEISIIQENQIENLTSQEITKTEYINKVKNKKVEKKNSKEKINDLYENKTIIIIIQLVFVGIMIISIKSNILLNEMTGSLDIVKLITLSVILLSIDLYVISKVFDKKKEGNNEKYIVNNKEKSIEKNKDKKMSINVGLINRRDKNDKINKQQKNKTASSSTYNSKTNSYNKQEKLINQEIVMKKNNLQENNYIKDYQQDSKEIEAENEICENEIIENELNQEIDFKQAWIIREDTKQQINIDTVPFRIGKSEEEVELWIDDNEVNNIHARILLENNRYYLEDLYSKNGTFVNGNIITSSRNYSLKDKDVIKFSDIEVVFKMA